MTRPNELEKAILQGIDRIEQLGLSEKLAIPYKARDPNEPLREEKETTELRLFRELKSIFKRQGESALVVAERYRKKYQKETGLTDDLNKALEYDQERLRKLLLDGRTKGGLLFLNEVGARIDPEYYNRFALDAAENVGKLISGINESTLLQTQDAIAGFIRGNYTIGELADVLPFSESRALGIAVTETTRAFAEGYQRMGELLKEQYPGVRVIKRWYTNRDDKVCNICAPLHNKVVSIENDFGVRVGEKVYTMQIPPAHPNCRCWVVSTTDIIGEETELPPVDEMPKQSWYYPQNRRLQPHDVSLLYELDHEAYVATQLDGMRWVTEKPELKIANSATVYEAGEMKNKIVTELSQRTGLEYDTVNKLIKNWAETSNDSNALALKMQVLARDVFGTELSAWQKQKIAWMDKNFGISIMRDDISKYAPLGLKESLTNAKVKKFFQEMYNYTQEEFQKAGIKHVYLTRGVRYNNVPSEMLETIKREKVADVMFDTNPLESWSAKVETAKDFSLQNGVVLSARVPIERVIGTARTGFGCLNEFEFVIIGNHNDRITATLAKNIR